MRQAAGRHFADVVIGVPPGAAVGQGHAAADAVEAAVQRALPESDVVVHVEPETEEAALRERASAPRSASRGARDPQRQRRARRRRRRGLAPPEAARRDPLEEAHDVAVAGRARDPEAVPEVDSVQTHLEPLREAGRRRAPSRGRRERAVARIVRERDRQAAARAAFPRDAEGLVAFLTLGLDPAARSPTRTRGRARSRSGSAPSARDRRRDRPHRAVKLCMFSPKEADLERGWPGRVEGDRVIQLAAQTLQSFFTGGGRRASTPSTRSPRSSCRPPVLHPPWVRDFYAFEEHVTTPRAARGRDVPPEWYEIPVFYFSNPAAIYGPEDKIPYPAGRGARLRARGRGGDRRRRADRRLHAHERLVGARPAAREMQVGLGPAKGKDFATTRAGARHARRVRRSGGDDGRARERRGALAREPRRHVPHVGRDRRAAARNTVLCARRHHRLRNGRRRVASSSTATGGGSSRATSSSSRSRGSACCGTASAPILASGSMITSEELPLAPPPPFAPLSPPYQLWRLPEAPVVFRDSGPAPDRGGLGLEGFSGIESILYHLQSPCRVSARGVRADRPRGVGARRPPAPPLHDKVPPGATPSRGRSS